MVQLTVEDTLVNKPGQWDGDMNHFAVGVNDQNQMHYGVFVENDRSNDDRGIDTLDVGSTIAILAGVTARVPYDITDIAAADTEEIPQNTAVSLIRDGLVYVRCEEALAAGASFFVRRVATGSEVAGSIRSDADGGDAIAFTGGVEIIKGGGAGGVCLLKIHSLTFAT